MKQEALQKRISDHIYKQFRDRVAQKELRAMGPTSINWVERTQKSLDILIPQLPKLAQNIFINVPQNLNTGGHLIELLESGSVYFDGIVQGNKAAAEWHQKLLLIAAKNHQLAENLESQQVSSEIQRVVCSDIGIGKIVKPNRGSIYPDLLLIEYDYSKLPNQSRSTPVEGPCLRGQYPSNVPDGCEIKTNQGKKVKVDAHGAHPGLHIGITWEFVEGKVVINGVWGGYIRIADHRESGRNVKVTTVKYSFGHDLFISLL